MLLIKGLNFNAFSNIATEEYLLREKEEEIFILWQNEPAIIVGKHQNALAEINLPFVMANNIPVVRRLTGGGTVFHDKGNINFTFIKNADDEGKMIDFRKYAGLILEGLQSLGLKAEFSPRNDIFLDNKKISGNAEHIFAKKKRVLHHGTLLFNSDLGVLNEAIKANPERFTDKAVNSVRSTVANIIDFLEPKMDCASFFDYMFNFVSERQTDAHLYELNNEDKVAIEKLNNDKYSQWDWNFGYSPSYRLNKTIMIDSMAFDLQLKVEKGLISEVDCHWEPIKQLLGQRHKPDQLRPIFQEHIEDVDSLIWQLF
jgi:lipoate-protein ligase A